MGSGANLAFTNTKYPYNILINNIAVYLFSERPYSSTQKVQDKFGLLEKNYLEQGDKSWLVWKDESFWPNIFNPSVEYILEMHISDISVYCEIDKVQARNFLNNYMFVIYKVQGVEGWPTANILAFSKALIMKKYKDTGRFLTKEIDIFNHIVSIYK